MSMNTQQQGDLGTITSGGAGHTLVCAVTVADLEGVLRTNALQVANTSGAAFDVMAAEIFDDLDLARVEQAAVLAGGNAERQAEAAREAIADQLVEQGVLKRKVGVIDRVDADHPANQAGALGAEHVSDVLAVPDLLPVLQEARAWFCTSGHIASRLDTVINSVREAQAGRQQDLRSKLLHKVVSSFGATGDIYSDSWEASASVSAAQNLGVLAKKLCNDDTEVCKGTLLADGVVVGEVSVQIDGALTGNHALTRTGRRVAWAVALPGGATVRVAMFESESAGEESWVVDDAEAFYTALIGAGVSVQ